VADTTSSSPHADVAVVGAGAAGLYAALVAARAGARVALVSRSPLAESASYWAQGGIAAALAADDSPARHAADTIAAGRGAARASAVEALCAESPGAVHDLEALGVHFDRERAGALSLGLEGGHSARRIVHAGGSATGRRITRQLSALVATDDRIEVLERTSAAALLTHDGACVGLLAGPVRGDREAVAVRARGTILATGGAAALWERTTNPRGALGVGLSLAHSAGAALADLELVQFHPTALAIDGPRDGFLVTEAVRGEGALLLDQDGNRFVDELAPRDEVALAIQRRLRATGALAVSLDLRPVDLRLFPNIAAALADAGIDPAREAVPVAPAAHYTMGGIATDLDGHATLPGLFAIGECACTGIHGANRLASNSLAECFVFGRRAALTAADRDRPAPDAARAAVPSHPPQPLLPDPETRAALWRHAGLERDAEGLAELARRPHRLTALTAAAGLAREESRGAHQRRDHPDTDPALDGMHAVLHGGQPPAFERWE
jgi:L-aspartate oxidase